MDKIVFVVAVVAVVAALLLATGGSMYNSIVRKDIAVNEKWSQVENVLQRGDDTLPPHRAAQPAPRLMDDLAGAENRIAVERMRYNEAVRTYNTAIRVFPGSVVAGFAGYRDRPFFEAEAGAKEVPKVDFGK